MESEVLNQQIVEAFFKEFRIELYIKREDQLHPYISGNKFRKLKYNLEEAKRQGKKTILTFGGAYSNHIHATAYAGKKYGFTTIGIIRGEELGKDIKKTLSKNQTLNFADKQGMQFYFISRSDYKLKDTPLFTEKLKEKFGDFYLLPEGGTNDLAIKGCEEILIEADKDFDFVCCAVGTGGTLSGLINSSFSKQEIIGFPVLKEDYLHKEIAQKVTRTNWSLNRNHYLGGYAKVNPELIDFINWFYKKYKITLDPIYTGKLIFGVFNEIRRGNFPEKSRILAIHTGGLQGISGVNAKLHKKGLNLIEADYEF